MRPVSTFFDIQLSNSRVFPTPPISLTTEYSGKVLAISCISDKIPSLTVRKRKNRCIPDVYWGIAIFVVVANYSILFFPFTFFLDISHLAFGYELIICSETTDIM